MSRAAGLRNPYAGDDEVERVQVCYYRAARFHAFPHPAPGRSQTGRSQGLEDLNPSRLIGAGYLPFDGYRVRAAAYEGSTRPTRPRMSPYDRHAVAQPLLTSRDRSGAKLVAGLLPARAREGDDMTIT